MKSILKKVAGIALVAGLALGIMGCPSNIDSHVHTFSTEWKSDATHHWHAATCEHTTEVKDKAEHNFGEWTVTLEPTEEAEGTKEKECSVCHYKVEEAIAKLEHTHTFATDYSSDATHHWHAATCEHTAEVKDKAEHTFGEWTSNNDATTWADGTKSRTCTVCSYKESETEEGTKLQEPDYTKCVVGDFILKNGTVLSKDSTPQNGTVAAVIFRAAANGKPALGVGIVHTETAWCIRSASGFDTNISDLVGDETSGYIDGSNSWDLLVAACEDLKNATAETIETVAQNYPAFNYCRKYGTKSSLAGDLANGWYLPTVAELYTIYQNKTAVNESLSKAGGNQFGRNYYWSCCQSPSYDNHARMLWFDSDWVDFDWKSNFGYYVCSVRAFN